jgi:hypothetical protein
LYKEYAIIVVRNIAVFNVHPSNRISIIIA